MGYSQDGAEAADGVACGQDDDHRLSARCRRNSEI